MGAQATERASRWGRLKAAISAVGPVQVWLAIKGRKHGPGATQELLFGGPVRGADSGELSFFAGTSLV